MQLWGVINLTSDSFYAGSRADLRNAIRLTEEFLASGAAIIDIGAESTRPGAKTIPAEVQLEKLNPFLSEIRLVLGDAAISRISIDTRDLQVMQKVIDAGVCCINDVSGGSPEIFQLIAATAATYVLTHSKGTPATMQTSPSYSDVLTEVTTFLTQQTLELVACGAIPKNIIWDPGIGFGKTVEHNLTLIANMPAADKTGHRLLMGVSRKSFIGHVLQQQDPANRLAGTLAVQVYLTLRGCDILRLHDVREMVDCLKILEALNARTVAPALSQRSKRPW